MNIKKEIITELAKHTSGMSDAQFRKHWSEWLEQALTRIEEETAEDICKIVDDIELSRLHTSLEGWRAFKGIRNAIRDKYILSPSEEKESDHKKDFGIEKDNCKVCQEPKKGKNG